MKMLMIVCPESNAEELRDLFSKHDIHAYSTIHDVTGEGEKGKKLGTRIWPGKSMIVFTVLPRDKERELLDAIKECKRNLLPEEGMHAFVLPVEEAF
jgi:nitrogen regulatory protein PII